MKWLFGKTALWLSITAISVALAFGAGQNTNLPDGDGKRIIETACTACHDLAGLNKFKGTYGEKEWRDMVMAMVGYGAQVSDAQVPVLVGYLTKNFGPQGGSGGGAKPAASDEAGKKLLENACTSCHGLDGVQRLQLPKDGWETVIKNMIGYGATVAEPDIAVLSEYLAKVYGPKQ